MTDPPLALLLLRASRWFDRQLLDRLEAQGWPRLSSAQSLVFAHLEPGGVSTAALARSLGVTRQSAHELVAGLARLGLLATTEDPRSRRSRLVVLTDRGHDLARSARTVLDQLESELAAPRGQDGGVDTRALRRLLQARALQEPPASERGGAVRRTDDTGSPA